VVSEEAPKQKGEDLESRSRPVNHFTTKTIFFKETVTGRPRKVVRNQSRGSAFCGTVRGFSKGGERNGTLEVVLASK